MVYDFNLIFSWEFTTFFFSSSFSFPLSLTLSLCFLYFFGPLPIFLNLDDEKATQFRSNHLLVCFDFFFFLINFMCSHFICDHPVHVFVLHRPLWFLGTHLWQQNMQLIAIFRRTNIRTQCPDAHLQMTTESRTDVMPL